MQPDASIRPRPPSVGLLFVAVAVFLVACLLLGGGTRGGFVAEVALQGLAVPLLLGAAWRLLEIPASDDGRRGRVALVICLLIALVPLAQLVPLPPSIWTHLPGRSDFESNIRAAGLEPGWLPLSVVPSATWLSALALLPPMAVFLGVLQLGYAERRRLSLVILVLGMIGVGLGLLQVAQGQASPLRFYDFTNTQDTVGFFANRNHHAAFLYCLLLIAAAFAVAALSTIADAGTWIRSPGGAARLVGGLALLAALVVLLVAQAIARSRAGIGLTIVALIGALALAYLVPAGATGAQQGARAGPAGRRAARWLLAAIVLAVLFTAQFVLYRVLQRFDADPLLDARVPFARNATEAAIAYMPFGSGLGTFVPVYLTFEKASDNVAAAYANRAHNDFLELWLEAGAIGLVAMIVFVIWVVRTSWRVWRRGLPGAGHLDNLLACAAGLALILLLGHSMVDYPLRTTALMAISAWAVAMIAGPVGSRGSESSNRPVEAPKVQESRSKRASPWPRRPRSGKPTAPAPDEADPPSPGKFVPAPPRSDWPDAWRPRKDPKPPGD